ncbi:MAG: hypothetical protein GTO45_28225 [Candidatus Aminicenantes bacterium]|nr:hypothetical protein [Candidatus Aminicenantes bacterium]NIM82688.1 hypothetical protein [Candidatus Aminicenantes bacterium]NIN22061.1 hypothetical protein [Candidatus Aminicenantes bacterium]NIN45818.1 hypothetical protein [Candidatus Aminicenantes bacterium]NIN88656.1 hypothetical protein [Candidatus Aminicenantes bacterium]
MKTKPKRNFRILKIAGTALAGILLVYIVLLIFAPHQLQRLGSLLDQMMAMQRRAENQWLEGDLDTEHMENLYAIYGIRCENTFHKMTLLQLIKNYRILESASQVLQNLEKKEPGSPVPPD